GNVADIAFTLGLSNQTLILTVLPHAIPELTAVFLPLAAFLVASRASDWHKLLAATVVTVSIAIPVLVVSALIEAYAWPEFLIDAVY
ncbi:MAG: stage II sporulation protein M, partial [Solirubrobacterales bacterium]